MKTCNINLNGWLNINKPHGQTSAKVVSIVKKITKAKKVGHGGTLDPLASGVLPIAINKATKQVELMMDHKKTYKFCITFGEFRDTYDSEGKIELKNDFIPSLEDINNCLHRFIGYIEQIPPKYSALKLNGRRAYELARDNIDFELKPRKVEIKKLEFYGFKNFNTTEFSVECGRGCYVRSLAVDIAKALKSLGYVSELIRTKVGDFDIENSLNIENLDYNSIEANILNI